MSSVDESNLPPSAASIPSLSDQTPLYRDASSIDSKAIATLHADSWRRHYRGAFPNSFLDGDVFAERLEVWRERLTQSQKAHFTVVAEVRGSIVGFVHMILDGDPTWGTLLDNLHVAWHFKRKGIGRRLMQEGAERLLQRGRRKFYLWVLDQNVPAQRFYLAQGANRVETSLRGPFPGGGYALGHRMAWPDASVLLPAIFKHGEGMGPENEDSTS